MIIKALTIENFKGIREPVRVEFKPITLLFGPNSAGKSTIVQVLHYIREILERNNVDADRSIGADESFDLGGFRNLIHNHDLTRRMRFKIEMSLDVCDLEPSLNHVVSDKLFSERGELQEEVSFWDINQIAILKSCWIELEVRWSFVLDKPLLASYSTGFNDVPFATISCADDGKRVRISYINPNHCLKQDDEFDVICDNFEEVVNKDVVGYGNDINLFLLADTVLPAWGKPLKIARECFVEECEGPYESLIQSLDGYLSQLLVGPGELLLNSLNKVRYIGPIRKTPPRNYSPLSSPDATRWASGLAAWDLLYQRDLQFINQVNRWLAGENCLDTGYRVKLKRFKEIDLDSPAYLSLSSGSWLDDVDDFIIEMERVPEKKRLTLVDEKNGIEVQPHDVGIGISQVLPIVVAALEGKSQLGLIEQPELHIHPRIQAELGDLFLEAALGEASNSFIIETHSEHLLLRLMRRIRESHLQKSGDMPISPENVGVWYVEQYNSSTVVREMPLNKRGDLVKAWPGGFFEEGLREVF
ncbi:MAG: AAA family ATPase [Geobacteraceae bacterium]